MSAVGPTREQNRLAILGSVSGLDGTRRMSPNARAGRLAQCALVLEDNPVGDDSRLAFESFPGEVDESYASAPYRMIGGQRMSQPAYAAYQGGDWGPYTLELQFRAGVRTSAGTPNTVADLERMLIDMERKANWCLALQFPLERALGATTQRVMARATTALGNNSALAAVAELAGKVKRVDPPIVLVVYGSWRVTRGFVTGATLQWGPPWHPDTARPYGCVVRLTIQPLLTEYPTWQSIRNRSDTSFASAFDTLQSAQGASAAQAQREIDAKRRNDNDAALANRPGGLLDRSVTGTASGGARA